MIRCFKKSSIYALNQVGNSTTTKRRVLWLLILLAGIVSSGVQITQFLKAYYEYPVVVNIYTKHEEHPEFPAVTICNQNRVRRQFLPCLKRGIGHRECDESTAHTGPGPVFSIDANCSSMGFNSVTKPFNVSKPQMRPYWLEQLYFELDDETKMQYGHQQKDFIKFCEFASEKCPLFKHSIDGRYGNCFTFNAAGNATRPSPYFASAPMNPEAHQGLILVLNVEADSYLETSEIIGARVQIHEPHHEPDVSSLGIDISPGFRTSISLSRSEIRRLPAPYESMCLDYLPTMNHRICRLHCESISMYERCGCNIKYKKGIRHCDLTKMSDYCCMKEWFNFSLDCPCPLPCKETVYKSNVFTAFYPSRAYYNRNLRFPSHLRARENIAKLLIFYETSETTVSDQKPMYDSSEIFSQIGGQTGLWLGVSMVMLVFECIEALFLFLKYTKSKRSTINFVNHQNRI